MANQPNFDFDDFANKLQAAIVKAVTQGTKRGSQTQTKPITIGQNFASDIKKSINEYDKLRETEALANKAKQRSLQEGISLQAAELRIAAERTKRANEFAIKQKEINIAQLENLAYQQSLLGNYAKVNKYLQKKAELEADVTGLQKQNKEIDKLTTKREKQIKQEEIAQRQEKARVVQAPLLEKAYEKVKDAILLFYNEGQTATQAIKSAIDSISVGSVLFGQKTAQANVAIQNTIGDLSQATGEAADQASRLALITGASAESAGKLAGNLSQLPNQTLQSANNTSKFAANLARSANVAPGKVIDAMANSTEEIAKFSSAGGQNFARAAVGAQKMGVEVGKIAAAAEALLDFENSINKQMEASVLLGREINFDKARELALQGDLVGATQNMLTQLGGEAEFNRMNLIQKKALAESMGMSVADLGKLVKNQDKFNVAQKEALANGSSLDEVLAMGGGFISTWGGYMKDFGKQLALSLPSLIMQFNIMRSMKKLTGDSGGGGGFMSKLFGKGGAGPTPPGTDSVSKINTSALLKGAGAMAIASVGIFIFAKAVQELAKVEKWPEVAMGLGLFAGTMLALGFAMQAAAPALAIGVGPLLAFGGAVLLMGVGVGLAAAGLALFMTALTTVPINNLLAVGPAFAGIGVGILAVAGAAALLPAASIGFGLFFGVLALGSVAVAMVAMSVEKMASSSQGLTEAGTALVGMGAGLASVAANGLKAMPVLGALMALATVAPALSGLADLFGGGGGGGEKDPLLEELKELRKDLKTPVAINIDGKKLSEFIRLASNTTSFV